MNYSRQREIILDTLEKNPVHPTAEKLMKIIKTQNPDSNIGIATVYRNLSRLADAGIIKRIEGLENSEHFDHNTHTHYHFLCCKCNNVYDIDSDVAADIVNKVQTKEGFIVTDYDIIFKGICKKCQK